MRRGVAWHKTDVPDNPVSKEMAKLLKIVGVDRQGLGFYGLRHGFETIAGQTRNQPAVDRIMGHAERSDDMAAVYRQEEGDDTMVDRLRAVSEHVRKWYLSGKPKKKATKNEPSAKATKAPNRRTVANS
jgi:hypothetical protein